MILLAVSVTQAAQAQTFSVLHNFAGGDDGGSPYAGLTIDRAGNLYGTAVKGGAGYGTVYKLEQAGAGWTFTPIYEFAGGSDGAGPAARVIIDPYGNLYGTTTGGGGSANCGNQFGYQGCGTVFKLSPQPVACVAVLCTWTESLLYRFIGGSDGALPFLGDLVFDQTGSLYGTASAGGRPGSGCSSGCGVVFELTPSQGAWTETVLHGFTGIPDGLTPYGGVIFDNAGDLYGTTSRGGASGFGTAFELTPSVSGWTENILYNFQGRSDGGIAIAGLTTDGSGNFYGATANGGTGGGGTAFDLTSSNSGWTFSVLDGLNGGSNSGPVASLVMDSAGNLYGTTSAGGAFGYGSVFELIHSGGSWTYTDLHDFTGGDDGANPSSSLVLDSNSNLYGTASAGGANGNGVVFELMPSSPRSPVVISNYQTGTDNAYLEESNNNLTAPSLVVYPKLAFRGGNNCAVMAVSSSAGLTQLTPVDNESETWHAGPSIATGGFTWQLWYVLGDTAGTNKITIATTGTAANSTDLGAILTEVANCDISSLGGSGTLSTSATDLPLTLILSEAPNSGDMVWAAFIDTSNYVTGGLLFDADITVGNGFTLLSKSLAYGKVAEYSTSTTSTSVPITYSASNHNIEGVAVVIKQGPVGTGPPATKYIDHYQVEQSNGNNQIYFPCSGNLIVGLASTVNNTISSVSGNTGTWETPSSANTGPNGNLAQVIYAYRATCLSTTSLTPMWSSPPISPGTEIDLISVSNADNSAATFDKGHTASGHQTTGENLTTDSITASGTGEMIFNITSIDWHTLMETVTDSNGHTPVQLAAVDSLADDAEPSCPTATPNSTLNEDNGWAYYINSSDTSAVTFIYSGTQTSGSCLSSPEGVLGWASASAAFK